MFLVIILNVRVIISIKMIGGGTIPFLFLFFFCSVLLENWNESERLAVSTEKKSTA